MNGIYYFRKDNLKSKAHIVCLILYVLNDYYNDINRNKMKTVYKHGHYGLTVTVTLLDSELLKLGF